LGKPGTNVGEKKQNPLEEKEEKKGESKVTVPPRGKIRRRKTLYSRWGGKEKKERGTRQKTCPKKPSSSRRKIEKKSTGTSNLIIDDGKKKKGELPQKKTRVRRGERGSCPLQKEIKGDPSLREQ